MEFIGKNKRITKNGNQKWKERVEFAGVMGANRETRDFTVHKVKKVLFETQAERHPTLNLENFLFDFQLEKVFLTCHGRSLLINLEVVSTEKLSMHFEVMFVIENCENCYVAKKIPRCARPVLCAQPCTLGNRGRTAPPHPTFGPRILSLWKGGRKIFRAARGQCAQPCTLGNRGRTAPPHPTFGPRILSLWKGGRKNFPRCARPVRATVHFREPGAHSATASNVRAQDFKPLKRGPKNFPRCARPIP